MSAPIYELNNRMRHSYTVVTVAHKLDMPLLKLQARSLSKYLDPFVKEILVVDNSINGECLDQDQLLHQYGALPVRVLPATKVVSISKVHGWFTQQILKLMIARHLRSSRYIILDAKNHLLAPVNQQHFEAKDGRIRTGWHAYGQHTLKRYLLHCCDYLSVSPKLVMDRFIPTTPPFTMMTEMTRFMLDEIEKVGPFTETFMQHGLAEFFLYGTFIVSKGYNLEDFYKYDNWMGSALWKGYNNERMQQIINEAKARKNGPFFAAHRATFRNMDDRTVHALAKLWQDSKLFANYHDARRFVEGCAKTYS